jgi:phosphatidate cytidylyltransferase
LVLLPLGIAVAWFGPPWLSLATALAGAGMAWEWSRLCRAGRIGISGAGLIVVVLAAIAAAAGGAIAAGVMISIAGAAVVLLLARREPGDAGWLAIGALWLALPCVLLLWLRHGDGAGRATVLWLFAIVWATDIGAYAVGRRFGGPLLAPRWSPRKTWAGLVGGALCAALAGWGTAHLLEISVLPVVLLSAGLAIVGQFGDLAESVAKRRFGVKDSSGLIPGHGGLLDRLDGLLAVIPAVALLTAVGGGLAAWR